MNLDSKKSVPRVKEPSSFCQGVRITATYYWPPLWECLGKICLNTAYLGRLDFACKTECIRVNRIKIFEITMMKWQQE
jgi:hypothetical protein